MSSDDWFLSHQGQFTTVMADPPWPYDSPRAVVGNGGRGAQDGKAASIIQASVTDHYSTMSIQDICQLPVALTVRTNAHLYLWTTNSFIVQAHEVARRWGFIPKTLITWVKHKKDDPCSPSMKTGYYFRSATEHCLFAVRGSLRLTRTEGVPTWFYHPRLPHSVKPDSFRQLVQQVSPPAYLEMFARKLYQDWEVWGNEVDNTTRV